MIPKETSQGVLFATGKKDVTKGCGVPLCKSDEIKNEEGSTLSELPAKTIPDKKHKGRTLKELDELRKQQKRLEEKKRRFYFVERTEAQEESVSKYGFYTENNCYYFNSPNGNGFFRGSNFVMEPLYHISSVLNAKRLFRLTNVYGHVQVLEFSQKDLISVSSFKLRCESVGNFLFEGQLQGLNRIKAMWRGHATPFVILTSTRILRNTRR